MALVNCEDCKFFVDLPSPGALGECRLHPPVLVRFTGNRGRKSWDWPTVKKLDNCGDGEV